LLRWQWCGQKDCCAGSLRCSTASCMCAGCYFLDTSCFHSRLSHHHHVMSCSYSLSLFLIAASVQSYE
jgi:hypothetical protein